MLEDDPIVKVCQCGKSWLTSPGDPFMTCPSCRVAAKPKKKKGTRFSFVRRETKKLDGGSPWGENAVRDMEDR